MKNFGGCLYMFLDFHYLKEILFMFYFLLIVIQTILVETVIKWPPQKNSLLCQLELVSNENGQKYFNNKPNTSPLDAKQTATIIRIRMKLAFVLNKTFMNMIENK